MLLNLLTEEAEKTSSGSNGGCGKYSSLIMIGVLFVVIIAFMIYSKRSQKKRQQETVDMLNAIQPGNKVKTIGGICGIVVEVCPEDNTFVLETGTEASGKSYLKFDKQAVYQTDAVVKKADPASEEAAAPTAEATEATAESEKEEPAKEEPATEEKKDEE